MELRTYLRFSKVMMASLFLINKTHYSNKWVGIVSGCAYNGCTTKIWLVLPWYYNIYIYTYIYLYIPPLEWLVSYTILHAVFLRCTAQAHYPCSYSNWLNFSIFLVFTATFLWFTLLYRVRTAAKISAGVVGSPYNQLCAVSYPSSSTNYSSKIYSVE